MRSHMHDRTLMHALHRMLTFTLTLSRPDRLTPPSRLYPRSSHAGSFCGRQKSRFIDVDEAMCYDRCGYDRCSYNGSGYDRWSLRGTSSQAPCPGLGPAEERARAPSPATL